MTLPRRILLSSLAFAALALGSGCTPSSLSARRTNDNFAPGSYMAASDGLGRSVTTAEHLDHQASVDVANVPE